MPGPATIQVPGLRGFEDLHLGREIGSGGEGCIYEVLERKGLVCKVLHPDRRDASMFEKLKAMVARRDELMTKSICWPHCLVAESGRPVGYLMPRASGKELQRSVFIPPLLRKMHPSWTRQNLVSLAEAVLQSISTLHRKGILLGDVNARNILVRDDCSISLIDCDSFQVGEFMCPVGSVPYLAPELIGLDLKRQRRTMEHENFAIATLMFMVLLPGKPPFSHRGGTDPASNVRKGHFPYPLGDYTTHDRPAGQWGYCWSHLPHAVKRTFHAAFGPHATPTSRPSVEDWMGQMQRYRRALDQGWVSDVIFPSNFKVVRPEEMERHEERRRVRDAQLASLREGQEVKGVVKNLKSYGAFVDLGGVDGLLHVSDMELALRRVSHPSEVVAVGDEVMVKVLRVDRDRERPRISLGIKQLERRTRV